MCGDIMNIRDKKVLILIFIFILIIGVFVLFSLFGDKENSTGSSKDSNVNNSREEDKNSNKESDDDESSNKADNNNKKYDVSIVRKNAWNAKILDGIKDKKDMIVYFCDESTKNGSNYMVNAFMEIYNVNIEFYDISKEKKSNLNKLNDYLMFNKNFLGTTSILYIKDGTYEAYNNFSYEYDIYNQFIEKKLLSSDSYSIYIQNDDDFNKIYNSKNVELIVDYPMNDEGYIFRSKVNKLSKEYKFKYHVLSYHFGGTVKGDEIIDSMPVGKSKKKTGIDVPVLLAVREGKVIDYMNEDNAVIMKDFLKKNGIVR